MNFKFFLWLAKNGELAKKRIVAVAGYPASKSDGPGDRLWVRAMASLYTSVATTKLPNNLS